MLCLFASSVIVVRYLFVVSYVVKLSLHRSYMFSKATLHKLPIGENY